MSSRPSRIVELATLIATSTAKIDEYLRLHNHPQPSFDVDAPAQVLPDETPEIEDARTTAVEASIELQELLQGAESLLCPFSNMSSLQAIYRFKIASKFPIHEEISFAEMADLCGLYEHDLRRIVRYAIAHHRVFREPRKGFIAHSTASRRLAEDARMQDAVGLALEECWPAHARTVDALSHFNKSQEPNASGFSLANNTSEPLYAFLSQHPERTKRFAGAMSSSASAAGLTFLSTAYHWADIKPGGIVVDIGGSQGHVSVHLAQAFPSLRFIVQDLPGVASEAKSTYRIPANVADRVTLMAHDFFAKQPVKDVDVFLIRYVFHNWSDAYCVRILRNLVPALKPGARIVVNDHLMPEPNTLPLLKEREIRNMDLVMLTLQNAREREKDDWASLFEQADKKFRFISATAMEKSATAVIVAVWEGT